MIDPILHAKDTFHRIIQQQGRLLHAAGWTREILFEGTTDAKQIVDVESIPGVVAAHMAGWRIDVVLPDRVEMVRGGDRMAKLKTGVFVGGAEFLRMVGE